ARGLAARGPTAALQVEGATIHWRQRHDLVAAADAFLRAAELPGAPFYAGRIYAELLVALGRKREARDWLRAWLPRLPADQPAARVGVVAARLAELDRELAARP
ncbi:MAG: hypothetical protein HY302_06325, partial [Opitutae bacterium]|nr:hypothetical protein [Opitutae bacterium]